MDKRVRNIHLDILRGIAVFLVIGAHFPVYPVWGRVGHIGVDLFYVLSGFLISGLLFTEYQRYGRIRMARFFVRRALKLYPSFYVLIGLTVAGCLIWRVPLTWHQLIGEATMTQNYVGGMWGHTWSLAVEEHFYVFLPLTLAAMIRFRREDPFHAIPYVFACLAIGCLALRYWTSLQHPIFTHTIHYQPSHLRVDSLFFGVLLGYLHNFHPSALRTLMSSPWRSPLSFLGVLTLAPAFFLPYDDRFMYTFGFTLLYIGFGIMLLVSVYPEAEPAEVPAPPGPVSRTMAALGVHSYSVYLWNGLFAQLAFIYSTGHNPYIMQALCAVATIIVGIGMSKFIERPVLRMREHLMP